MVGGGVLANASRVVVKGVTLRTVNKDSLLRLKEQPQNSVPNPTYPIRTLCKINVTPD